MIVNLFLNRGCNISSFLPVGLIGDTLFKQASFEIGLEWFSAVRKEGNTFFECHNANKIDGKKCITFSLAKCFRSIH